MNRIFDSTPAAEFSRGHFFISDPDDLKKFGHKIKLGIHSASNLRLPRAYPDFYPVPADWAQHGIVGRGVLLDLVKYYTDDGKKPLPYDPWTSHPIPAKDLEACAKKQGITFKTGDILILRVGFTQKWLAATRQQREELSAREETLCVLLKPACACAVLTYGIAPASSNPRI